MSGIDPSSLYPFLSKSTGTKFPLGNDVLERVKLSDKEMEGVTIDLGRHLAVLHSIEGQKYGGINPQEFGKGRLVGSHEDLYPLIVETYKERLTMIDEALDAERRGQRLEIELTDENRNLINDLLNKRNSVLEILEGNRALFDSAPSRFLNGNIHFGSIAVKDGKFVGLIDFRQSFLGDPVNDLAYFSVMPYGDQNLKFVLQGWKEKINEPRLEEKLHIYRLIESYRKITTRYVKHRYLQDYPEPLLIAQEELAYYNKA